MPPLGNEGSVMTNSLMKMLPASIISPILSAFKMFLEKIAALKPKLTSLASSTASRVSLNLKRENTGPKSSEQ